MINYDANKSILILSCGTRNKIVQYFKTELNGNGKVLATDSSELAPALYEADQYFIVPRIDEEGYLETILNICQENKVRAVLSLIDPELSLLAKHRSKFLALGVKPIVSKEEVIELAFDKYLMNEFLIKNGFNSIRSYIDKDLFYTDVKQGIIDYPVFVKPVKGSASISISKVSSKEEIDLLFNQADNLMIQEFMPGKEYGADVYIDMISKEVVSIFIKEKLKMRAGETDKSVSYKDEKLFALIIDFVSKAGFSGVIDIDIFKIGEEYYISEVNPRFGGGYPHAYECGVNIPKMIIDNLKNRTNESTIENYDENTYMLKYNEVKMVRR